MFKTFKSFIMEDGEVSTTSNIVGGNPMLFKTITTRKPLVETVYDYASCQFTLDYYLTGVIKEYARHLVKEIDLGEDGYVVNPHITVCYGLTLDKPIELFDLLESELIHPTYVDILDVDIFECDDYNVLILPIKSEKLNKLNRIINGNLDVVDTGYGTYNPHITLAYLKKDVDYTKYTNRKDLTQFNVKLDKFQFSDKLGTITNFNY